ncbi:alpha-1,6-mannosyltransferase [Hephaestia caeni]|uniref:Alpha-1,6-mannosyltransferase n=1 Tax=Hephaestia caeni TaxID=645617 RepID=A0A397PJ97_9SPHN|nr:glycosyltransferase [Hephaestia caeni]RIA45761.1 alpha-1,6-mannosyltransferase [Hephaestia caeni]
MRIVDVCAFYTPAGGGVRTYVERKLRAGADAGHEIVILAPGTHDEVRHFGRNVRIVTIAAAPFPLDRTYHYFDDEPALHAALDALAPDMVEVSSPWTSAAMVARWRGAAPRALIMHSDPLAAYAYRWFGAIADRATIDRRFDWFWRHLRRMDAAIDLIVCASHDLSRRLTAGGLTRVVTEPMGVEPGLFTPANRDETLRAELLRCCNLPPDAVLLIGVGRFAPEKRWPMVVDAVTRAGLAQPVGLMLIGDGRERDHIARAAFGSPHIRLVQPVRDRAALARILASADALVHGCEAETFCMTAAEARASGLPVIVPDSGGARDHWRKGQGALYRGGDGAALAQALTGFLADDPSMHRARAADAAREVRSMDDHFAALFARYAQLARGVADAA